MKSYEVLLQESVAAHGHLCAGQVIGVRMAMLGCKLVGVDDPKSERERKSLMVYVEIDRCAMDAIQSVTGCRMGRRTLKFRDFGINAATFLNLKTQCAYRIVSTESSRDLAKKYALGAAEPWKRQLIGYQKMPDSELFVGQPVQVHLDRCDMPGPTQKKVSCMQCGQVVRDGREVEMDGRALCRPCAGRAYFTPRTQDQAEPEFMLKNKIL